MSRSYTVGNTYSESSPHGRGRGRGRASTHSQTRQRQRSLPVTMSNVPRSNTNSNSNRGASSSSGALVTEPVHQLKGAPNSQRKFNTANAIGSHGHGNANVSDATQRAEPIRYDAFTVFSPNPKKKAAIAKQAKKEEDDYMKHKESQKMKYVRYVGTVGGGGDGGGGEVLQGRNESIVRQREYQQNEEDKRVTQIQHDHRRVNSQFLDQLERRKKSRYPRQKPIKSLNS